MKPHTQHTIIVHIHHVVPQKQIVEILLEETACVMEEVEPGDKPEKP